MTSIYLIDTNILVQWLAAYLPNVQTNLHLDRLDKPADRRLQIAET